MDHKELILELPASELASLTLRSNFAGLWHLFWHICLLFALGVFMYSGWPGWQLGFIGYAICLIFLFTLLHETVHDTPFRSLWLNRPIGAIIGFILLVPSVWFRYFHLAHHRHTHDLEKDPELYSSKPHSLSSYLIYLSGVPMWWSLGGSLLMNAIGNCPQDYVPSRAIKKVIREARITLVLYILVAIMGIAFQLEILLWLWIFPLLVGQPFLRAYLLAEHTDCPHVSDMLENTRTVFTNPAMRFIAWNMPYHTEHHSLPNVPFHQLPRLHQIMKGQLKMVEPGYGAFHKRKLGAFVAKRSNEN